MRMYRTRGMPYRGGVSSTTARLVLALRVAYVLGAALFVVDIVIAIGSAHIAFGPNGLSIDPDPTYDVLAEWIALFAFAFAALGAVITVVATTMFTKQGIDGDADLDEEIGIGHR
jgi:hypothetical protein